MIHFTEQPIRQRFQSSFTRPVIGIGFIIITCIDRGELFSDFDLIHPTLKSQDSSAFFSIVIQQCFYVSFLMVGITLFTHQHTIEMKIHLIEHGISKIVDTINIFVKAAPSLEETPPVPAVLR